MSTSLRVLRPAAFIVASLCFVLAAAEPTPAVGPAGTATSAQPGKTTRDPYVCPTGFAEAKAAHSPCGHRFTGTCRYDDGRCACELVERCSGVPPPPFDPTAPPEPKVYRWACEPKVRPDGCPGDMPSAGSRCRLTEDTTCYYGSCCVTPMVCRKRKWQWSSPMCPP